MAQVPKVPESVQLAERLDRSLTLAGIVRPLRQWIARAAYRLNRAVAVDPPAQGAVLYYDGTDWVTLSTGTVGNQLTTHGAGTNPTWDAPGGGGGSSDETLAWLGL